MLRRSMLFFVGAALLVAPTIVGVGGCSRSSSSPPVSHAQGQIFGTTYAVTVVGEGPTSQELGPLVARALDEVDATMSTYREDSDLVRFNGAPAGQAFELAPMVFEVLAVSGRVFERSGGAFDPTVGPLVRAWGFGPDERPTVPPDVAELRALVGWGKLEIDGEAFTITKSADAQEVDLSAVAKGFGVDHVADALTAAGAKNFMVEVGGEVRARGRSPSARPWRIGIERPDAGTRTVEAIVELDGRALATSGDYRNYYEIEGRRVSHTIDPRTGAPIEHALASVSVVADTCAEADAWATALNVLGPDAGMTLARSEGLEVFMIVRGDDGFELRHTEGFPLVQMPE